MTKNNVFSNKEMTIEFWYIHVEACQKQLETNK